MTVGLVARILRGFEAELRGAILDWEADRALEAVAYLLLATLGASVRLVGI